MVQFYASFLNVYLGLISIKDYHLHPDRGRRKLTSSQTWQATSFCRFKKKELLLKKEN